MRQGSRSKGFRPAGGHGGVSILINPVQIYQSNKLNQGAGWFVCLGFCWDVHMHAGFLPVFIFICTSECVRERPRGRFVARNYAGVPDEAGLVQGNIPL